jgi:hypothetical protein
MPPVAVPSHHPIVSQAPKPSNHFSWRTRARPLIVLAALLMASAGLDIAKAGFFDEVFGGGEPMERYHYEGPRHFRPARHFWREYSHYGMSSEPRWARAAQWGEARGTRHRFAHRERLSYLSKQEPERRRTIVDHGTEPAAHGPSKLAGFCYNARPLGGDDGHVDALLHDATLQPGDSVMTAKGVRVFEGGGGCPHKNTDFLALAEIPGLPKRERRALAAIDKVIKTPRVAVQVGGFAAVAARARPARASHE